MSLETLSSILKKGHLPKLSHYLGFQNSLIPLPSDTRKLWGWHDTMDSFHCFGAYHDSARLIFIANCDNINAAISRSEEMYARFPEMPTLLVVMGMQSFWFIFHHNTTKIPNIQIGHQKKVSLLEIDRFKPDLNGLQTIERLSLNQIRGSLDKTKVYAHLDQALQCQELTKQFFSEFRNALKKVENSTISGPKNSEDNSFVSLMLMLRLVFLYILQRRRALDADAWFIFRKVSDASNNGRSIYNSVLKPLFFETLNVFPNERSHVAKQFGNIPFLNGGLFEPMPLEQNFADVTWPNDVLTQVIQFFESYHFSHAESSANFKGVDPEMLGHVFELLMFSERRASSGSFYTPRKVVRKMVKDAIFAHVEERTAIPASKLTQLLNRTILPRDFSSEEISQIKDAIFSIRILDPAVGTGAFLVESLDLMAQVSEILDETPVTYQQMATWIHHSIFGVDIQPTAAYICSLRIWLRLLQTLPADLSTVSIDPLPNIRHRIATGDSIVNLSLFVDQLPPLIKGELKSKIDDLSATIAAKQQILLHTQGTKKHILSNELSGLQRQLGLLIIDTHLRAAEAFAAETDRANQLSLFSIAPISEAKKSDVELLISSLKDEKSSIEKGLSSLPFDFKVAFPDVFFLGKNGGFDVVITNPPWVRTHRIQPAKRELIRKYFRANDNNLWPDASTSGIKTPFGKQIDMSSVFVERSIHLLNNGGTFCGLLPSKLLRTLHASSLRALLAAHNIDSIEDLSEAGEQLFGAVTYPTILRLRKRADSANVDNITHGLTRINVVKKGAEVDELVATKTLWQQHPAEPWAIASSEIVRIINKLRNNSIDVGQLPSIEPRRGIFTGINDLFIKPIGEFQTLLGPEVVPYLRPIIRGKDVEMTSTAATNDDLPYEILLPYRDGTIVPFSEVPDTVNSYFEANREALVRRSGHDNHRPLWQVFRLRHDTFATKVVWSDISKFLAAKTSNAIPLNTVYYIPTSTNDRANAIAAYLNSSVIRLVAYVLGEHARGNYRRHFSCLIRMLPFPVALCNDGDVDFGKLEHAASLCRNEGSQSEQTNSIDEVLGHYFGLSEAEQRSIHSWLNDQIEPLSYLIPEKASVDTLSNDDRRWSSND